MNVTIRNFKRGMEDGTEPTGKMFIRSKDGYRRYIEEGDYILINNDTGVKSVCPRSVMMDVLTILHDE